MRQAGEELGPLSASRVSGGRSNLTYRISDRARAWILRTPPAAGRTASAHDVGREFRVTTALFDTDVPVARAVLHCEDDSVLGVPFTVTEFVTGAAVRTPAELASYPDLGPVVDSLVTGLATLHRLDHITVGLGGFGRPDGYAMRQLRRWSGQWETVGDPALGSLAREVASALSSQIPEQVSTGIVHGDYRIDNTLLSPAGEVSAIIDWELSTIGDPVADVAMMCAYRNEAFDLVMGEPSAWTSPRLPPPDDLARLYEKAGGVPLEHWEVHLALAHFKIAVIAAGIEHRRRLGADIACVTAGAAVAPYLELARDVIRSGSHQRRSP